MISGFLDFFRTQDFSLITFPTGFLQIFLWFIFSSSDIIPSLIDKKEKDRPYDCYNKVDN